MVWMVHKLRGQSDSMILNPWRSSNLQETTILSKNATWTQYKLIIRVILLTLKWNRKLKMTNMIEVNKCTLLSMLRRLLPGKRACTLWRRVKLLRALETCLEELTLLTLINKFSKQLMETRAPEVQVKRVQLIIMFPRRCSLSKTWERVLNLQARET